MKDLVVIAAVLMGCGRAAVFEEPAQMAAPAAPAPKCEVDEDGAKSSWRCDTVRALEISSLKVTNTDGTEPWNRGQPRVITVLRNTTGVFLNYPGVRIEVSEPPLQPRYASNWLYGMNGCDDTEMSMPFNGSIQPGTAVTFTAIPVHINGAECALPRAPVTLTVMAP